ncbi:uncharacterized protein LOC125677535 isoform X3 [Ostrea edulis]|uniref:uncharacterized protein LOC125677535 isoform X3 n=1 Tax=Ostrea edulis TaxID=37623 RepID=UPI0024AEDD70|nr:uncharacterized protein LOC125677535 isoform X3 [Ostrea edulis]XP_055998265.1 uncharacterized protein LOC125677535 isoform X3 [Ostrea edulis]XP_055998266.1 uncharacterized protein LOC125677535 isoform X3 [Ostrea edulis]
MDASKLLLIALVLVICGGIFHAIGLALPYWVNADVLGRNIHAGLWKTCSDITGENKCKDITPVEDWLKAVRAMGILGVLTLVVAALMTVLKLFVMKDRKPIFHVAIGTSFAGAFFIIISIAVYAGKIKDMFPLVDFNYHFAFAFSIIGMIAAIAAGVAMLVDMKQN